MLDWKEGRSRNAATLSFKTAKESEVQRCQITWLNYKLISGRRQLELPD